MSLARQIVEFAIQAGSSDIHLEEGSPIAIRINSDIRILENVLEKDDMSKLLLEIVGEEKIQQFEKLVTWIPQSASQGSHVFESTHTSPTNSVALLFEFLPDNLPRWQDLGYLNLHRSHPETSWPGVVHRSNRIRQINHSGRFYQLHSRDTEASHPHDRRSHRIRVSTFQYLHYSSARSKT